MFDYNYNLPQIICLHTIWPRDGIVMDATTLGQSESERKVNEGGDFKLPTELELHHLMQFRIIQTWRMCCKLIIISFLLSFFIPPSASRLIPESEWQRVFSDL